MKTVALLMTVDNWSLVKRNLVAEAARRDVRLGGQVVFTLLRKRSAGEQTQYKGKVGAFESSIHYNISGVLDWLGVEGPGRAVLAEALGDD